MNIILIILLASFKTVTSLKCYRCNERSKTACEEKQTVEDCSNQFRNPICLTVTYSEKLNNGEKLVHPVVKKCSTVTSRGCDGHCSRFWMDCKAKCCHTDGCNNDVIRESNVIHKKKRRAEANSASTTMRIGKILLPFFVTISSVFARI